MPTPAIREVAEAAGLRSNEIEVRGSIPPDLWDQVIDSGLLRMWTPEVYGGSEQSVAAVVEALESVAFHDGATSWCAMIALTTSLTAAYLPPEWAEKIYADPRACTGGFGMPSGVAIVQDDGSLEVTGEWPWGSGTDHCTWIGGGVRVIDADGEPSRTPDGAAAPFVFFDIADVELLDTWHVAGLKGSASTDYRVSGAVVPAGRWANSFNGDPVITTTLYRFSFLGALSMGVAAVALGLAERAIDELVRLGAKKPSGSSRRLSERATVQAGLSRAEAGLLSARAFLYTEIGQAWSAAEEGTLSDEHKRRLRLAAAHAVSASVESATACFRMAGGSAVYLSSPIQRVMRDLQVVAQHAMVADRVLEPLGRMRFGLKTDTSQF